MDPVIPMPKLGTPNVFSLTAYEALMGLLCSSGSYLSGPELVVNIIRPYFHVSQLHRLVRRA